ncbi:MAG: ATP-binding protein [Deltaproteobacteria bacterium]|nr:ATP-binding protein [Deltaproteobacteria bacterium]
MNGQRAPLDDALRQRAEDLALHGRPVPESLEAMSPAEAKRVLHELRVHQIELEMQNDELRRAQRELEDSRARYFDLYDLAPVGYLTLSGSGVILEANLTAARMLGVSRSHLVKQPLTRFIAPEDQDVYFLCRRRQLSSCELRMLSAKERTWLRLETSTGVDVDGVPLLRMALIDITQRKRAEELQRASEARYRAFFEQSRDALMTLAAPDWRFIDANPATLSLFGFDDVDALRTRSLWDCSPLTQPNGDESAERLRSMLPRALAVGSCFFDWTFMRRDGDFFPASVLLTTMEVDGRPLLQATVRDGSELKSLHARVDQADRLASVGLVAAGVAHEINNPLAHVLYNVESLAQDLPRLADVTRRLASQIGDRGLAEVAAEDAAVLQSSMLDDVVDRAREALSSTQRIRTISRALGSFSRAESSEIGPADVNRSIEAAISMSTGEVKYRARLVKNLGRLPGLQASETRLSQLFLNLLVNAAHAIGDGDVDTQRITIVSWADGANIFVEVTDTGHGIAPADLARVFDAFFTTKASGEGSGLGLAICKSIVAELDGSLSVQSEPGRGARFTVKFPIRARASTATTATTTTATTTRAHAEPGLRGRVLAIDDEWGIRETVKRVLGREHDVMTLPSAEEALSLLEIDQSFDVIFCDLMMPRFTGMELHQWLLEHAPAMAGQVVFLTGGAFTPKASDYLKTSGVTVIEKPFDADRLRELVSRMISTSNTVVH